MLTDDQQKAFQAMCGGKNVFVTGPAGCGKSFVIQKFAQHCDQQGRHLALTALTGVAALHIGGRTLHSWAGIGLGKRHARDLVLKIKLDRRALRRWTRTQTLVIDEVSMLSPQLLEKLDTIGREVRGNPWKPFGGIQVILTGDFCQLPPVKCNKFCFESPMWNSIIDQTVYLHKIIRQTDPLFQKCLSEIRMGQCSPETEKILRQCMHRRLSNNLGIVPTKLYSTRRDVDRINQAEIEKLKQAGHECRTYHGSVNIQTDVDMSERQKQFLTKRIEKDCPVPIRLELVVGAQIMLVQNLDVEGGLVNGSRGVVTELYDYSVQVRFLNGCSVKIMPHSWEQHDKETQTTITLSQIPLILAYSGTIHKTQSQTLDYVIVDLGPTIFEYGQAYTALSRVRSLQGLQIESLKTDRIRTHPKVKAFYNKQQQLQPTDVGKKLM